MGYVQQAVLEFDEEVRAPWRPRLVAVPAVREPSGEDVPERFLPAHPSRRTASRVGVCRPPQGRAAGRPASDGHPSIAGAARAPGVRDARAGASRRPRTRVRLTRRARRCALVLAVGAGVALGSWLGSAFGAGGDGELRLAGVTSVVVQPGDTLWSIAAPAAGDGDVRAEVAAIRRLNGLTSAQLVPGQTLQLP